MELLDNSNIDQKIVETKTRLTFMRRRVYKSFSELRETIVEADSLISSRYLKTIYSVFPDIDMDNVRHFSNILLSIKLTRYSNSLDEFKLEEKEIGTVNKLVRDLRERKHAFRTFADEVIYEKKCLAYSRLDFYVDKCVILLKNIMEERKEILELIFEGLEPETSAEYFNLSKFEKKF